jgi:SAM-dependent methyltransferase
MNAEQFKDQLFKQVGKTKNGQEVSESQIELIISAITSSLKLDSSDKVIDLCCGNGVLTEKISTIVAEVTGVDYSINLIRVAKNSSEANTYNITYFHTDIMSLEPAFFAGREKIYMYEGLQYLTPESLEILLTILQKTSGNPKIFIGGIPDRQKLTKYYDTPDKYDYYVQCEKKERPHMGRWWLMDEITKIASEKGFRVTYIAQAPSLYTSYYRFDCLLEYL